MKKTFLVMAVLRLVQVTDLAMEEYLLMKLPQQVEQETMGAVVSLLLIRTTSMKDALKATR